MSWFGRLKLTVQQSVLNHQKTREIAQILADERDDVGHTPTNAGRHDLRLPAVWCHKTVARVGDIVYLQQKNIIKGILLTTANHADPPNGKVSVTSPMGLTLIGRHPGDRVRVHTLDGEIEYDILKIV